MRVALSLALAALSSPAFADEMWSSSYGPVIWETDLGTTAVLLLQDTDSGVGIRLLVPGLAADMSGGRGTYTGVWVSTEGEQPCVSEMVDPVGGYTSPYWGTFTLTFVHDSFPSDWAGAFGACLDLRTVPFSGTVQTG